MADLTRERAAEVVAMVGSLYDRAIDAVLGRDDRPVTASQAKKLLKGGATDQREVADQIQTIAMVATPVIRRLAIVRKIPGVKRVPLVLTATTTAAVAARLRAGVREVQVIGSYLASRIEAVTGRPADPALVKRAAVELYIKPERAPTLDARRIPLTGLARMWLVRGFLGRDSTKKATKAIDAVDRLDVHGLLHDWSMRHAAIDVGEAPAPGQVLGTASNDARH
jgi:hypothetical protein